jgi:hypothetical protein
MWAKVIVQISVNNSWHIKSKLTHLSAYNMKDEKSETNNQV